MTKSKTGGYWLKKDYWKIAKTYRGENEVISALVDELGIATALIDKSKLAFANNLKGKFSESTIKPQRIDKDGYCYHYYDKKEVIEWAINNNLDFYMPEEFRDYCKPQITEQTEKPLSWQKERTLNNTIAVLLEVIDKKLTFKNQAELVNHIIQNYEKFYGLGKTNLDTNFPAAKRELEEEKKRLQVK